LVGKSTLEVCVARKHISIPLFVEVSGSEYTCKLRRKALPPHLEIAMARLPVLEGLGPDTSHNTNAGAPQPSADAHVAEAPEMPPAPESGKAARTGPRDETAHTVRDTSRDTGGACLSSPLTRASSTPASPRALREQALAMQTMINNLTAEVEQRRRGGERVGGASLTQLLLGGTGPGSAAQRAVVDAMEVDQEAVEFGRSLTRALDDARAARAARFLRARPFTADAYALAMCKQKPVLWGPHRVQKDDGLSLQALVHDPCHDLVRVSVKWPQQQMPHAVACVRWGTTRLWA